MDAADTQVLLSQRVVQKDVTITGVVQVAELLKLMDRAACLSAERLAKQSCFTLSMDDLRIFATCPLGHHIIIEARVHRVFNTSMEVGVHIDCINHLSDASPVFVCEAFFTFVAMNASGSKSCDGNILSKSQIQLPPMHPMSQDEHRQHVLAGERRRLRFTAKATVQAAIDATAAAQPDTAVPFDACLPSRTVTEPPPSAALLKSNRRRIDELETMELVFPHHVQHHGTTFGGEIMAWIFCNAEHVAEAYANGPVRAHYLDEVWFRQKSTVGDRLRFRSRVNYTRGCSLEVGVRVDAWEVGGEMRHITSAFLVFEADHILEDIRHHSLVTTSTHGADTPTRERSESGAASCGITTAMRRYAAAQGRAVIRSQRTSLRLRLFPLSVPLSPVSVPDQCYANVLQAVTLHTSSDWQPLCTDAANAVDVTVRQDVRWGAPAAKADVAVDVAGVRVQPAADMHDEYFVRFETTVACDYMAVTNFLLRSDTRAQWDHDVRSIEVVHQLNENNAITRVIMKNASNASQDLEFVLLRSVATAGDLRTIAFRSVELDSGPYADAYTAALARPSAVSDAACVRGAIVTASFVISKSGASTIMQHYYHVPKQFLTADTVQSLRRGLGAHKDTSATTTKSSASMSAAQAMEFGAAAENPWLRRTVTHFAALRNLLMREQH